VWKISWLTRHICGVPQNPLAYNYVNVTNAFPKLLNYYLQITTKLFASGETLAGNPQKERQFRNEDINGVYLNDKEAISMCVCARQYTRVLKARKLLAKNRELTTRNTNHVNDWILV